MIAVVPEIFAFAGLVVVLHLSPVLIPVGEENSAFAVHLVVFQVTEIFKTFKRGILEKGFQFCFVFGL